MKIDPPLPSRACLVLSAIVLLCLAPRGSEGAPGQLRAMGFKAANAGQARRWQQEARRQLFTLMMGGKRPPSIPLDPHLLQRIEIPSGGYVLEEMTLQSLPDRKVHAWMTVPTERKGKVRAVLALHGHGGTGEEVVQGRSLYWYGRALAEMGYAVIAPDIGSHDLQHPGWTLMGERVWDAIRCLDYLTARPEVDAGRIAVAGLSLGGETAMYVAALDERVQAVDSSGWLTTIENMKQGHCPCWNFAGLEEHFDFADIFACIAPRRLVCEIGEREAAPGGFPAGIARKAFEEIRAAYRVFKAEDRLLLDIHSGGHVFVGKAFWSPLREALGAPYPWSEGRQHITEVLRRGEIARRLFSRALGVLDGWWAKRDPGSDLLPRTLDQLVWAPGDNAADLMPFLFLTAFFVAPERLSDLSHTFQSEQALTNRLGALPDWYSLTEKRFVHPNIDLSRLIFGAAEYCKDGLLPMTEAMGQGAWTDRMIGLLEAVFQHAPVKSDSGMLPADDTEVNGELLQVLSRVYAMAGEEKYWKWGERIADAYCFEVLPRNHGLPAHRWDFQRHTPISDVFSLNDHGNEIVGGLAEFYVAARAFHPEKAERYRRPLEQMFEILLGRGRNADGLWYGLLRSSTGEVLSTEVPDTWGYALSGTVTFGMVTGNASLKEAGIFALKNLDKPRYLDWAGADSYADSIEGGLLLLNRFPRKEGFHWLEKVLPLFLGKQQEDGIVEGWYGDGNYARTALMAALFYTQGARCQPWRNDLRFGAVRQGKTLRLAITAPKEWQGRVFLDVPRHRLNLRLPFNYPRLNEFPEWFTVEPTAAYGVKLNGGQELIRTGRELAEGIPLALKAGGRQTVEVRRL